MDEKRLELYLDVAKVVTPLLLAIWAGAWFLVKQLIFKPLKDLATAVGGLRDDLVRVESGFNTRLVVVEQKVLGLEHRNDQPPSGRNL